MIKLLKKVKFPNKENRMKSIANTKIAREMYYSSESKNVRFLLSKRFSWMNNFINENDVGIEVGSGAGFSKDFIKNQNFKLTDLGEDEHLDFKNIDAQKTGFENESFDYVIASNMIHHIPFPIKFFKEMNRILKKSGRLIIFESYCSIFFQIATILMKHEGFDFTLDVWDEKNPKSDEKNAWHGNITVQLKSVQKIYAKVRQSIMHRPISLQDALHCDRNLNKKYEDPMLGQVSLVTAMNQILR